MRRSHFHSGRTDLKCINSACVYISHCDKITPIFNCCYLFKLCTPNHCVTNCIFFIFPEVRLRFQFDHCNFCYLFSFASPMSTYWRLTKFLEFDIVSASLGNSQCPYLEVLSVQFTAFIPTIRWCLCLLVANYTAICFKYYVIITRSIRKYFFGWSVSLICTQICGLI